MKNGLIILTVVVASIAASVCFAKEKPPSKTDWSIGAGVGVDLMSRMSGDAMYLSSLYRKVPTAGLVLERRLSKDIFFLFDVKGGYSKYKYNENTHDTYGNNPEKHWNIDVAAGARYVFNQGRLVELSGFFLVGFQKTTTLTNERRRNNDEDSAERYLFYDASHRSVGSGITIGFALERELIERLVLRFESSVAQLRWSNFRQDSDAPDDGAAEGTELSFGLAIVPMLALRFEI